MTKRAILLIKTGGVTVACAMVLAIVTVLLVKYAWPEVKLEQPADPSTRNLKSVGIALEMYSGDYEGLSFPVVDENEKRVYVDPTRQDATDTGPKDRTDTRNGEKDLDP